MMLKITRMITDLSFLEFFSFHHLLGDRFEDIQLKFCYMMKMGIYSFSPSPTNIQMNVLHGLISYLQFTTEVHGIPLIKHYVSHQMRR